MSNTRTLTLATLRARGACREQVALFKAKFGNSVKITEALCVEHSTEFSWGWAASNLLSAPARAAYEAATAPARAAYDAAIAAIAPAGAAYNAATASAGAAYEAATAPAGAAYDAAIASAWARAYTNDTNDTE